MPKTCGTLFLVGTPIGNFEDMSYRAVRILKEADLIAAEDTRHSMRLLTHFDIHTKLVAYHKFNESAAADRLCEQLKSGQSIALISDAGMPVISDPGFILVQRCGEEGIPVTVVPGPNAALCGVVLSGIDCRHFTFLGFIDKSNKAIKEGIKAIVTAEAPVVVYESPHRLVRFLTLLAEQIPDRPMSLSREITKQFEETLHGTVAQILAHFEITSPKGEFVLVFAGRQPDEGVSEGGESFPAALNQGDLKAHYEYYLSRNLTEKEAMKAVASDRGISKRDVYNIIKITSN